MKAETLENELECEVAEAGRKGVMFPVVMEWLVIDDTLFFLPGDRSKRNYSSLHKNLIYVLHMGCKFSYIFFSVEGLSSLFKFPCSWLARLTSDRFREVNVPA